MHNWKLDRRNNIGITLKESWLQTIDMVHNFAVCYTIY